jgi:hypothetical protein
MLQWIIGEGEECCFSGKRCDRITRNENEILSSSYRMTAIQKSTFIFNEYNDPF